MGTSEYLTVPSIIINRTFLGTKYNFLELKHLPRTKISALRSPPPNKEQNNKKW